MDLDQTVSAEQPVMQSTEVDELATEADYEESIDDGISSAFITQVEPDASRVMIDGNDLLAAITTDDAAPQTPFGKIKKRHTPASSADQFPGEEEIHYDPVVIIPPKHPALPYASSRSGVVFDYRMTNHREIIPEDPTDIHPEQPLRIVAIWNELVDADLATPDKRPELASEHHLLRIPIRPATDTQVALIHTLDHIRFIQSLRTKTNEEVKMLGSAYESIYLHPNSWLSASVAAGGAIEVTKAVLKGHVKNAIAVIRPPGHHAEHDRAEGFCIFNNVPVAARVAQQEFPDTCRKILILDWDVHHGNGIQRAFYSDPNILYISIHVHENGRFYPSGDYGDHLHCGEGAGRGRNVNIPWPTKGMGDAEYILAFQQVVMPIAVEFDPDLVMISAGFDAARGDPLGGCYVSPAGYGHMTHMLMQLAKGKVVAFLEGGYDLNAIAKSALAVTRTLMGEPPDRITDMKPSAAGVSAVRLTVRMQARFWKCLYPKSLALDVRQHLMSERLHDIIREWQSAKFWEDYKMSELFILRPKISRSFKNQVLATPNYEENRPLLIIFRDPPELHGDPHYIISRLELHNTWITDVPKLYIDWAVKHDFAVIDVNIPKHITDIEDSKDYEDADSEKLRADMTQEMALYLWENYVELSNSSEIFVLGIGDAYKGIVNLLSEHHSAVDDIDLTISFIANNSLRAVSGGDDLPRRYYDSSLVFVAESHEAFDPESSRKLKRKHGHVRKSPRTDIQEMLKYHHQEVCNKLLELTEETRARLAESKMLNDSDASTTSNVSAHGEMKNGVGTSALDEGRPVVLTPTPSKSVQSSNRPSIAQALELQTEPRSPVMGHFATSPSRSTQATSPTKAIFQTTTSPIRTKPKSPALGYFNTSPMRNSKSPALR